ncbi:hypothetical protein M7I_1801 [Glarea lozoyensis 74030]|uniref:Uncharacterized protein n=1 Tax=Glarea lozoyensis (strain ATCC 74030 / MF5533) TaxID=1104152 RepID=H0EH66_GLAL7|nr:hypothetical protein M7I_1801 [Glarea lozoyensis 74030]
MSCHRQRGIQAAGPLKERLEHRNFFDVAPNGEGSSRGT